MIVLMIDARTACGAKAATTIKAGKSEMNALAASATLRSTNSFSSTRSQIFQKIERSAHSWTGSNRWRRPLARVFGRS